MSMFKLLSLIFVFGMSLVPKLQAAEVTDTRNIRTGWTIPDEGYCDQPYVVVTKDGNWLCTFTTGKGREGETGQHVVASISRDKGKTWSAPPVDIEPADGPAASWVMPLLTPYGRVYAFYNYNGERIDTLGNRKGIRADTLGWYCYRYSDDGGRTWSRKRYRLPVRLTTCDRNNDFKGRVQLFWGIGKPIVMDTSAYFGFTKLGKYMLDKGEGWFFRSDNILTEKNAEKIEWQMLPDGEHGLRAQEFGSVQEEHNLVPLSKPGHLYCIYRTTTGYPCQAYSRDGGHSWTRPEHATYTPGGQKIKNPRACPRLWKTKNGKFMLWYHNHSGKDYSKRNPAWIVGGIEIDNHIHWGQPEILLYDPDIETRMSYPDLIEQDGRYWVTETNKSIARVHEIDAGLFEGLWNQSKAKTVTKTGLLLNWNIDTSKTKKLDMPRLPALHNGGGFSLDLWIKFEDLSPGQAILDSRDKSGKGMALTTTDAGTIQIALNDDNTQVRWDCDPGPLKTLQLHHVVVIVDGGPKIITFVVDGVLCDGGPYRQYGWGRFGNALRDVNGSSRLRIAASFKGRLKMLRIYNRYLRTSEAVSNYMAGIE
ncbi:MAG: sialidase family protein [Planctomycetota bacterium]|jgi:hypothetical protein